MIPANIRKSEAVVRAELAGHLEAIARELSAMEALWVREDLPADFLSGEAYPFHRALEDMVAEVWAASEAANPEASEA